MKVRFCVSDPKKDVEDSLLCVVSRKDIEEEGRRRRNRFEEPISMIKTMPEPRRGTSFVPRYYYIN